MLLNVHLTNIHFPALKQHDGSIFIARRDLTSCNLRAITSSDKRAWRSGRMLIHRCGIYTEVTHRTDATGLTAQVDGERPAGRIYGQIYARRLRSRRSAGVYSHEWTEPSTFNVN